MNNVHMVLLKNGLDAGQKEKMLNDIEKVDGVKWAMGLNSLVGPSVPEDMLPDEAVSMLKSGNYEIEFICSDYKTATAQVNQQIEEINNIVKSYSPDSMVIGESSPDKRP